jgi:hypothetical protein
MPRSGEPDGEGPNPVVLASDRRSLPLTDAAKPPERDLRQKRPEAGTGDRSETDPGPPDAWLRRASATQRRESSFFRGQRRMRRLHPEWPVPPTAPLLGGDRASRAALARTVGLNLFVGGGIWRGHGEGGEAHARASVAAANSPQTIRLTERARREGGGRVDCSALATTRK